MSIPSKQGREEIGMKFKYYDLGSLSGGEIVEAILSGNTPNIRLMDNSNYRNYKAVGDSDTMVVMPDAHQYDYKFQMSDIGLSQLILTVIRD